jgi:hypothetical protein
MGKVTLIMQLCTNYASHAYYIDYDNHSSYEQLCIYAKT